jgi:hypothetical protein
LEAVRNHFPAVVIIDELGSRPEAEAARTIASRGVRLIATAHGHHLKDVVGNPELTGLIGGGGETPVMGTAVALLPQRAFALYRKVTKAASALQAGGRLEPDEIREISASPTELSANPRSGSPVHILGTIGARLVDSSKP